MAAQGGRESICNTYLEQFRTIQAFGGQTHKVGIHLIILSYPEAFRYQAELFEKYPSYKNKAAQLPGRKGKLTHKVINLLKNYIGLSGYIRQNQGQLNAMKKAVWGRSVALH